MFLFSGQQQPAERGGGGGGDVQALPRHAARDRGGHDLAVPGAGGGPGPRHRAHTGVSSSVVTRNTLTSPQHYRDIVQAGGVAQLRRDVTALTSCLTTVWERSGRGEAVCSATLAR